MEPCIVHAGPPPASAWGRLRAHLPVGTAVRLLDLDALTPYWEAGRRGEPGELSVASLAERLRAELDPRGRRLLLGWGFSGLVAHAMARDGDHVVALNTAAPAAQPAELTDEALLPGFAAYLAVRRGRALAPVPAAPPVDAALAALAGEADAAPAGLRRLYVAYARARRRDRALAAAHTPPDRPLTLVQAARGLGGPTRLALGWEGLPGLEVLVSAGDHYSMLTEPAAVAHLAALLRRWLAPLPLAA
jgi:thioesterase domain-containing protein